MRARIVGIAELVDEVRARGFAREAFGHVLVILRMAFGDVGARQHDFGAHRFQIEDFFAAHLVGDDENKLVALLLRDECEPDAGIAGGAFHERVARPDLAGFFSRFDHRQTDAILDRSARIGVFELEEKFAFSTIEILRFHDRRVADQFENAVVDGHANPDVERFAPQAN